ncbi:hypothetical protein HCZ30_06280 [Marivivens donghaensis]|uniref:Uncharacterized protein n=1 Tax=Marivivens donghaensis TaxID=1699413 RepID=A0ABX0VZF8_9RHOB|nr:hypothetical protein [Marivivens donghaensis]NIY72042.1 hypothetical protein [Marivivens donghaensis]
MAAETNRPVDLTDAYFNVHMLALLLIRLLAEATLPTTTSPLIHLRIQRAISLLRGRDYLDFARIDLLSELSKDLVFLIHGETQTIWTADHHHWDGGYNVTEISSVGTDLCAVKDAVDDLILAVLKLEGPRRAEGYE